MYDKPKIVSFWKENPFVAKFNHIDIFEEVDLFTEVYAYDVMLPIIPLNKSNLNFFEEAILKFAKISIINSTKIADLLCIEIDLVKFIQNKLFSLGYFSKTNEITEIGISYLNELSEMKTQISNTYGKVFVEKFTNKLLPYIHIGDIQFEDVSYYSGGNKITVNFGTAGNRERVEGSILKFSNDSLPQLNQISIRKNIIKYNKVCEFSKELQSLRIDPISMIEISTTPEPMYFHNKIVLQDGDVDSVLISDAFSINIEFLVDAIVKNHREIIDDLKLKSSSIKENKGVIKANPKNNYYYKEIKKLLNAPGAMGDSTDERKITSSDNNQKLSEYYSAIEWTLHHHLKQHIIDKSVLDLFCTCSVQENISRVSSFAKSMGLIVEDDFNFMFGISSVNIKRYLNGEPPEMQTVLALSIIEAKYNPNSLFHNMIGSEKNFVKFIKNLKPYRDAHSHANIDSKMFIDINQIKLIYEKTVTIINLLLPNYDSYTEIVRNDINNSQDIVNADATLLRELGSEIYNSQDDLTKDLLRKIIIKSNFSSIEPFEYITALSRLIETSLRNVVLDLTNVIKNSFVLDDVVEYISTNTGDKCPTSLSTVKPQNFNSALSGKNSTLGGFTLAFVALVHQDITDDNLAQIIKVIDEILRLRRHGNDVNLSVNENKLNDLRKETFKIINLLGDIV